MPPRLNSVRALSSVVGKPPLPFPMTTPMRSSSSEDRLIPESSKASAAAATAVCEKRAIRRASRGLMYLPGSKSGISPATLQGYSVGSARVMGPMPDLPFTRLFQYSSTESPSGVTAPMPVTTTRLLPIYIVILLGIYDLQERECTELRPVHSKCTITLYTCQRSVWRAPRLID